MCRYLHGETHARGRSETRGAKRKLTNRDKRRLRTSRTRLIKKFNSEYRVTYQMIIEDAEKKGSLQGNPCQRVVEDFFRNDENVRFRKPREKIYIAEEDAVKRMDKGNEWKGKSAEFWKCKVAYHDTKKFPLSLTPAQRRKLRCNRIPGHLRKPGEGVQQGFTKPREKHSFIGHPRRQTLDYRLASCGLAESLPNTLTSAACIILSLSPFLFLDSPAST